MFRLFISCTRYRWPIGSHQERLFRYRTLRPPDEGLTAISVRLLGLAQRREHRRKRGYRTAVEEGVGNDLWLVIEMFDTAREPLLPFRRGREMYPLRVQINVP